MDIRQQAASLADVLASVPTDRVYPDIQPAAYDPAREDESGEDYRAYECEIGDEL